jgi:hypothetical protein
LFKYMCLVLLFSSKCTTVQMYSGRSGEGSHLPGQVLEVLLELVLTENKSWAKSEICCELKMRSPGRNPALDARLDRRVDCRFQAIKSCNEGIHVPEYPCDSVVQAKAESDPC